MTDLGPFRQGIVSEARGINNRGQVVGSGYSGADASRHALLWQNGKTIDLGALGVDSRGRSFSTALGINDRGQVVGVSEGYSGSGFSHAFLWENGAITDLGTLGGNYSSAEAINDRGQIVGQSGSRPDGIGPGHAFMWENGKMTDLGTLRADRSDAHAVNAHGDIVGFWSYRNLATLHAVRWSGAATAAAPPTRAPRLTDRRPITTTPRRASRVGAVATLTALVGVDRQATVTLAVYNPRSGKQLTMRTGTRLAATTLTQQAAAMRTMVGSRRTLVLKAILPAAQLQRHATYHLVLTAKGTSAKRSKLTIRFLG